MDPFTLISEFWWLGIPVGLVMGVLLTVNPAALPMLGTAVGIGASGALASPRGNLRLVGAFGAGMVVVYTAVGVLAGSIDEVTEEFLRPYSGIGYLVLGLALASLGLFLLVKPAAFCAACARRATTNPTMLGAFAAGIPAGFVNCPACAGVVLGVAASAAEFGNVVYSGAVMLALGVGHAGALIVLSNFVTKGWKPSSRALKILQRGTALTLIGLAGYFFYLAAVHGLGAGPRLA